MQVPKSGEVWCEAARCLLNPMHAAAFDLRLAQRYLGFGVQFTPQVGAHLSLSRLYLRPYLAPI